MKMSCTHVLGLSDASSGSLKRSGHICGRRVIVVSGRVSVCVCVLFASSLNRLYVENTKLVMCNFHKQYYNYDSVCVCVCSEDAGSRVRRYMSYVQ